MNKQELINELKRISLEKQHKALTHPESKNYYEGMVMAYSQVVHMVNTVLKLDELQKPVVPSCAEPWLKEAQYSSDVINLFTEVEYATDSDGFIKENWRWSPEFYDWLSDDADTLYLLCDALRYGYEVEKEPVWAIKNAVGNYLTKCALWGKDGVNYSFECNPSHRLLFTDKATADAAALLVNGTAKEEEAE
ncbi:DUF1642 domain-containing protein [Enterococcus lactis]|uniref:DUF1642 domain-containing protein n=1 Tax=Enterococcus lactis TaxID=357441 RepID=UPI00192C9B07|nr:DUF1642 domain-containing protein [Enterococcus lactis]EGP4853662.1 DUF1642 domain-containing protein [Enterococcus faecium]MBL4993241.1 hypothetical protein [Enterococcus lactis]